MAVILANRGYDVTALVRKAGTMIRDPHEGKIRYVAGELRDPAPISRVMAGMDLVISTANGVTASRSTDNAKGVNETAIRLIDRCEWARVGWFYSTYQTDTARHSDFHHFEPFTWDSRKKKK